MSASAIYNRIGDFYAWQQMPTGDTGVFFGFSGMNRAAMLDALDAFRNNSAFLTFSASDTAENRTFWINETIKDLTNAGKKKSSDSAYTKWLNWVYVAAAGVQSIRDWLQGAGYTYADYITESVKDTVSDWGESVAETVKYGIEYETEAGKTFINKVLPVVAILGCCYLAKKILD